MLNKANALTLAEAPDNERARPTPPAIMAPWQESDEEDSDDEDEASDDKNSSDDSKDNEDKQAMDFDQF